jgi:preprotein translocase subunit YajC
MTNNWLLAVTSESVTDTEQQTTATTVTEGDPNTGQQKTSPGFGMGQFVLLGLMFVIMYFVLFSGPKKRQKQQQKMVRSLKKNDRVRTIGGILGTVVDVQDDEITLKIDESNNTKIKVLTSAIGKNLSESNK